MIAELISPILISNPQCFRQPKWHSSHSIIPKYRITNLGRYGTPAFPTTARYYRRHVQNYLSRCQETQELMIDFHNTAEDLTHRLGKGIHQSEVEAGETIGKTKYHKVS
jgi:hypothetical protein